MTILLALACIAVDGDTLRCRVGDETIRVRLSGIDAPEKPGHCRKGRVCAPGDPFASTQSLSRMLSGRIEITPITTDRYGRTVASVRVNGVELSCHQLRQGMAIYKPKWDTGRLVKRKCPVYARP